MGYSCRTLLRDTLVRHSSGTRLRDTLVGHSSSSPDTPRTKVAQSRQFSARLLRVLKLHYQVTSSHLPALQILRVLKLYYKVASARPHFARSTRTISAERAPDKSQSRLHFAHSTRTISAKGGAGTGQIALSPAFRALDSAEGCARMGQIALSPAFRTLDTHDLRRGLRVKSPKRSFRTRLPQKLTRQSLQNERFVRDSLQKSSGNTHRSTHITQPCQAVSRLHLQTTSAHTPIPM